MTLSWRNLAQLTVVLGTLSQSLGCSVWKPIEQKVSKPIASPTAVYQSYGRPRSERNREASRIQFDDRTTQWGLRPDAYILEKHPKNIQDTFGTGCAFVDINGDTFEDAIIVHNNGIRVYRNNRGQGFTDVSKAWSPALAGRLTGIAAGDANNDGRVDVVITGQPGLYLLSNTGSTFLSTRLNDSKDVTSWWTSAAFVNLNRDGKLDLVVGRYVTFGLGSLQACDLRGVPTACSPLQYPEQKTVVLMNTSRRKFVDATVKLGWQATSGITRAVLPQDVDNDGDTDVFLGNDGLPSDMMQNMSVGPWKNRGVETGLAVNAIGAVHAISGGDWADIDQDKKPDIHVTTPQGEIGSLFYQDKPGLYSDSSSMRGLLATRGWSGAGTLLEDFDADGFVDIFIVNGASQNNIDLTTPGMTYRQPCLVFSGSKGGYYTDVSERVGVSVQRPLAGRGIASADVDHDGDTDILVTDVEGPARLFVNTSESVSGVASVQLVRRKQGSAIGSVVFAGQRRIEVNTARGFLSASSPTILLTFPADTKRIPVVVRWHSGLSETFDVSVGTRTILREGAGKK